jgi:hypothetical protein
VKHCQICEQPMSDEEIDAVGDREHLDCAEMAETTAASLRASA